MRSLRLSHLALFLILPLSTSLHAQDWGTPVWADEFNSPAGSPLDPTKWTFDIGQSRVNHEVAVYCPGTPSPHDQSNPRTSTAWSEIQVCDPKDGNVSLDGEHLVLRAVQRDGKWTSGRIKTQDRQTFQYGRIEARIKMPFGDGLWPAFWGLGEDIRSAGWPGSGEIDIMESVPEIGGLGPSRIRATIHGPGYSGDYGVRNDMAWTNGERVDTAFHIYGAIWSPYMIQFYLDDPKNVFFIATPHELPAGKEWRYGHPFFLILNLAVGSDKSWSGATDATTPNPAEMLVDYVRVYKAAPIAGPVIEAAPARMRTGETAQLPLKLTAKSGSGKVYLDCATIAPGVKCSLNPYVVDLSSGEATASLHLATQKSPIDKADVKVTAYTLSGDESSETVHISFKKQIMESSR
jgi:beta-glucanase (GH16 family)